MPRICIVTGLLLIALGLVAWTGVDKSWFNEPVEVAAADGGHKHTSITALIPAFVGFPLLILGTLGLQPGWRKHAMHGAVLLALLGTVGGLGRGLPKLSAAFAAENYGAIRPTVFSLLMGVICLVLLVLSIRSFIAARRKAAGAEA